MRMVLDRKKNLSLPRYKFHPFSLGSLMTFFKVASRSSTKLEIRGVGLDLLNSLALQIIG